MVLQRRSFFVGIAGIVKRKSAQHVGNEGGAHEGNQGMFDEAMGAREVDRGAQLLAIAKAPG